MYQSSDFKQEEPVMFNNLDEYINYVNYQKSLGSDCPILYLQQENDAQGNDVYRLRPSPFDQEGGMNPLSVPNTIHEGMTPMDASAPAPSSVPASSYAPAPAPSSSIDIMDILGNNQQCFNRKSTCNRASSCGKMKNTAQCGSCGKKKCGKKCSCNITPISSPMVGITPMVSITPTTTLTTNIPLNNINTQPYQVQHPPVIYNSFTAPLPVDPASLTSLGRTGLQAIPNNLPPTTSLFIANNDNAPYNVNDYPPFDPFNQQMGVYTNIDQIHDATALPPNSDNAMDPNWGGTAYTIQAISSGKYADNEIYKPMITASNTANNTMPLVNNDMYKNIINTPAGVEFINTINKTAYNPNIIS